MGRGAFLGVLAAALAFRGCALAPGTPQQQHLGIRPTRLLPLPCRHSPRDARPLLCTCAHAEGHAEAFPAEVAASTPLALAATRRFVARLALRPKHRRLAATAVASIAAALPTSALCASVPAAPAVAAVASASIPSVPVSPVCLAPPVTEIMAMRRLLLAVTAGTSVGLLRRSQRHMPRTMAIVSLASATFVLSVVVGAPRADPARFAPFIAHMCVPLLCGFVGVHVAV